MRKPILYITVFLMLYIVNMYFIGMHHPDYLPWDADKPHSHSPETEMEKTALQPLSLPMDAAAEAESATGLSREEAPFHLYLHEEAKTPARLPDAAALTQNNLVDIETLPLKVFLDIRYATVNNFTGERLYDNAKCYLHKDVAAALVNAAKYALDEETPFYFCLYDCYRPLSVQKIMFAKTPVPGLVSNPAAGSNHNRGAAVDLGPCNESGISLPMPTEFDDFGAKSGSYAGGADIPKTALKNRDTLQKVMRKAGFTVISKEWWHFDYKDAKQYPVLDIAL
jgi:D-alanyl-D-alanine dipeptidase